MRQRSGFTVLEVLIVLAVFGLMATLAILSLNSTRARLRDAQRLSDVSTVRAALSQYWLEKATYPPSNGLNLGEPGSEAEAFTSKGFVKGDQAEAPAYLNRVPTGPRAGEYYRYRGGLNGYSLRFQTESDTEFGPANVYFAHANGVDQEDAEK